MFVRSQLESLGQRTVKLATYGATRTLVESALDAQLKKPHPTTTVFCSHSHKDKDLILGLKTVLAGLGVTLYVDWDDPDMPSKTSGDTAERLREKIRLHDKFIVVVTENSKNSHWVPWELGVADRSKPLKKVALWPVKDDHKNFESREYMEVYQTIEDAKSGEIMVFPAGATKSGTTLADWLAS